MGKGGLTVVEEDVIEANEEDDHQPTPQEEGGGAVGRGFDETLGGLLRVGGWVGGL